MAEEHKKGFPSILIVEDEHAVSLQLTKLLSESFPKLRVDAVTSEVEAFILLDQAASKREAYDVVLLDFKLPHRHGELPETNQAVFNALRNQMPDTMVIHTTAYPDDPEVTRRILEESKRSPFEPRSVFLSKADHSWANDLTRIVGDVVARRKTKIRHKRHRFRSCFISYSHDDEEFVRMLYSRLRSEGLRLWYAAEHMKPGKKIHEEIEGNIRLYDILLLVLSPSSMKSEWVATEIRTAIDAEKKSGRRKLFPIRLVEFDALKGWKCFDADAGKDMATELREYFIPDFTGWEDSVAFERKVLKLLEGLKL